MKLNEESLFILIWIGQLYTVFMALGYLRNLLSNKKFQLFSFVSVIAYIALYQWINIIATVILWAGLCLSIYIIDRNIDIAIFYPSIILFFYIFIGMTIFFRKTVTIHKQPVPKTAVKKSLISQPKILYRYLAVPSMNM